MLIIVIIIKIHLGKLIVGHRLIKILILDKIQVIRNIGNMEDNKIIINKLVPVAKDNRVIKIISRIAATIITIIIIEIRLGGAVPVGQVHQVEDQMILAMMMEIRIKIKRIKMIPKRKRRRNKMIQTQVMNQKKKRVILIWILILYLNRSI